MTRKKAGIGGKSLSLSLLPAFSHPNARASSWGEAYFCRGEGEGLICTHLSYHSLLPGMCYEQKADLLSVHSHHFPKRLHCFVETGGHDRMGRTGVL